MIRCFVTTSEAKNSCSTQAPNAYNILVSSLRLGNQDRVCMIETPEEAEIILFAETHADDSEHIDAVVRVVQSPLYRDFKHKCAVHSGKDFPRLLLPGVYPSIPERWARWLQCYGGPYLAPQNPYLENGHGWDGEVTSLAGFLGACERKRVRVNLKKLKKHALMTDWTKITVTDSTKEFVGSLRSGNLSHHLELKRIFVRQLLSSKFALCPRGTGPSSFRIFEAMQLGRAPVIIADDWTPPLGPDWPCFSIRIPERQMHEIPKVLGEREADWQIMGQRARKAWAEWCAPSTIGPAIVESALLSLNAWKKNWKKSQLKARAYCLGPRKINLLLHKVASRKLQN
jgi:hypothetical protein